MWSLVLVQLIAGGSILLREPCPSVWPSRPLLPTVAWATSRDGRLRDTITVTIEGFPCLHEFQVGGIALMPTCGPLVTVPGLPTDSVKTGYRSAYSHEKEVVKPGYYSVLLEDYQIQAELTATPRVAF